MDTVVSFNLMSFKEVGERWVKYIMESFILNHILIMLFIFPVDLSYFLMSFPEGLRFFSISYKTDLLSNKFIQSLCIWECLYFAFIFEEEFCQLYLFDGIFLDALCICHSIAFWPPIVLVLAYMWWVVVLLLLSWLFVGLGYNKLTMIWQDVDLSVFINWGFCWIQMCRVTL